MATGGLGGDCVSGDELRGQVFEEEDFKNRIKWRGEDSFLAPGFSTTLLSVLRVSLLAVPVCSANRGCDMSNPTAAQRPRGYINETTAQNTECKYQGSLASLSYMIKPPLFPLGPTGLLNSPSAPTLPQARCGCSSASPGECSVPETD